MAVLSICGVILSSTNPEILAGFYSAALGLDFIQEEHGDLGSHFGTDIGKIHFGIHPPENMKMAAVGKASTVMAFNVDDFDATLDQLKRLNSKQTIAPHDQGFGLVAAFEDPDGNQFEVVALDYEFDS